MGKEREREGRGGGIVLQKQAEPGIIIGMTRDSQLSYPKEGRVAEFPYSVVFLRITITVEKTSKELTEHTKHSECQWALKAEM